MIINTKNSKYVSVYAPEFSEVQWTKGFWKEAVWACATQMVPQLQKMFEAKEISHVVENFRICAGKAEGDFDGTVFGDGDFYKWMEAELYSAAILKDSKRFEKLEEYIALIGKAQQDDGYISTKQIIEQRENKGLGRMGDINEFEVYNMGHLCTSACLYKRITGKDSFLKIAEKAADYLQTMYEEAEKKGDIQTAVCPSHYMGLIEMYRTTGEKRYLELAQKAITLRDFVEEGLDDNQDRIPLKEHEKIIGHAVRATYLYAGVTDLFAEKGDKDYFSMLHKVWRNMVDKKIYLTGGIGALYNGTSPYGNFFKDQKIHQAFGYEYQLPNITAYNETCASIGLVMWAYRMFMIEPKAEYFDVLERAMLNVNLAAVSLDGKRYFYENMLRRAKSLDYELVWPLTRSEYILSYCCPPNLARTIMQSEEYVYVVSDDAVWCGMYGENEAHFSLKNGADFRMEQITEYPYQGKIKFRIKDVKNKVPVTLKLRIPSWCENADITIDGNKEYFDMKHAGSYVDVQMQELEGTEIILDLHMKARFTVANTMIEEDSCQVAVEYGPLVYCMESLDAEVESLDDIKLDTEAEFSQQKQIILGREIVTLKTNVYKIEREKYDRTLLYQPLRKEKREKIEAQMIPYFAWDNREYGEMRIWMPYV